LDGGLKNLDFTMARWHGAAPASEGSDLLRRSVIS
jgi:hypothetical protein